MGGLTSQLQDAIAQIQTSTTIDTSHVMNILLRYLLNETRLKDFYVLSSDQKICKDYVTFMANDFYKYFYELQIYPTEDKGRLLFRKGSELQYDIKDADRQKACFTLAYFYVRIFQIYGAIALTVIENVSQVASVMTKIDGSDMRGSKGPGSVPYPVGQVGGEFKYGDYRFLTTYSKPYNSDTMLELNFTVTPYYPEYIIYFRFDKTTEQRGEFIINNPNSGQHYILLTRIDGNNLIYIELTNATRRKRIDRDSLMERSVTIKYDPLARFENQYTLNSKSVSRYFNAFFAELINYIEKAEGRQHPIATVINPNTTPPPSDERLAISRLKDALLKTTHKPVCVARALQLLRKLDGISTSQICKTSFSDGVQKESRSGVPIKGESLDKSPGLDSLSTLFYTISETTPNLSLSNNVARYQYMQFLLLMATRFGDKDISSAPEDALIQKELKAIKNYRDREVCQQIKDQDIPLDKDTANRVQAVVNELSAKQRAHSDNCMKIINQLFKITYNGSKLVSVEIHPKVLAGGIPELERINAETRELLIKYYEDCESKYIDGMQIVMDYIDSHAPLSAPAPPSALAPAPPRAPLSASAPVPVLPAPPLLDL
jgi:hypothetical protein